MKVQLTFTFDNLRAVNAFLATVDPELDVTVSAEGKAGRSSLAGGDTREANLGDMKKAELAALAQSRGLHVTSSMKKEDLISLIESGNSAPITDVPQSETTPVVEEHVKVQQHQAVDRDALVNRFKESYQNALQNGVNQDLINTTVGAQLQRVGHPHLKLGDLPDNALLAVVEGFTAHMNHLSQQALTSQAGGSANSFI